MISFFHKFNYIANFKRVVFFISFFTFFSQCKRTVKTTVTPSKLTQREILFRQIKTEGAKTDCDNIGTLAQIDLMKQVNPSKIVSYIDSLKCTGSKKSFRNFFMAVDKEMSGEPDKAFRYYLKQVRTVGYSLLNKIALSRLATLEIPGVNEARLLAEISSVHPASPITGHCLDFFRRAGLSLPDNWYKKTGVIRNWKLGYGPMVSGRNNFFNIERGTISFRKVKDPSLKTHNGSRIVILKTSFNVKYKKGIIVIHPYGPAIIRLNNSALFIDRSLFNEYGTISFDVALKKVNTLDVSLLAGIKPSAPVIRVIPTSSKPNNHKRLSVNSGTLAKMAKIAENLAKKQYFLARKMIYSTFLMRKPPFIEKIQLEAIIEDPSLTPEISKLLISKIVFSKPVFPYKLITQARTFLRLRNPKKAFNLLKDLSSVQAGVLRSKILRRLGNIENAKSILSDMIYKGEQSYSLFKELSELNKENDNISSAVFWMRKAFILNPTEPLYPELLNNVGRFKEADKIITKHLLSNPQSYPFIEEHYKTLIGLKQNTKKAIKKLYELEPFQSENAVRYADYLISQDKIALAVQFMKKHLSLYPWHLDLLKILIFYDKSPVPRSKSAASLIKLEKIKNLGKENSAIFVLNETKIKIFSSGNGYKYIHRIVKANSLDGADRLGEIVLPQSSHVFNIHTIKSNGKTVDPYFSHQKESYSLKNLTPGDFLEVEYLVPLINDGEGHFFSSRFFFSQQFLPSHHTHYEIKMPSDMEVKIFTTGGIKRGKKTVENNWVKYQWDLWDLQPRAFEPLVYMANQSHRTIRFIAGVSSNRINKIIKNSAPWPESRSLEIEKTLKSICIHNKSGDCYLNLLHWIRKNIISGKEKNPLRIFHNRKGSRAHLLKEFCNYSHLKCQLFWARTKRSGKPDSMFPETDLFTIPVIRGPNDQLVDPRFRFLPPGVLPPALSGATILLPGVSNPYKTLPQIKDNYRVIKGTLKIKPNNSGLFDLSESATGFLAAKRKNFFSKYPKSRIFTKVSIYYLARFYPGAELLTLNYDKRLLFSNEFTMKYKFGVPIIAVKKGGRLELKDLPFRMNIAKNYRIFSQRKFDFLPNYVPYTKLRLKILPIIGWTLIKEPLLEIKSKYGYFRRELSLNKDGSILVKIDKHIKYIPIKVKQWPEFQKFIKTFIGYETLRINFKITK